MKIAIIGHGNVGGTLAKAWAKAGHDVIIGTRKAMDKKAARLTEGRPNIMQQRMAEAVQEAEVILVAIPAPATAALAKSLGQLKGKIIIDATNALWEKPEPYETGYHAFKAICKAEAVKAFNSTGFENMANPVYGDTTADMFIAGDSQEGKKAAMLLARDAGFETVYDFGGGDKVKALEHFAFGWINLAIMQGQGRQIALKILKR
jgi:predicted dinucleotide-binding enzyme